MIKYFPTDFEQAGKIIMFSFDSLLGDDISSNLAEAKGLIGWSIINLVH